MSDRDWETTQSFDAPPSVVPADMLRPLPEVSEVERIRAVLAGYWSGTGPDPRVPDALAALDALQSQIERATKTLEWVAAVTRPSEFHASYAPTIHERARAALAAPSEEEPSDA